MAVEFGGRFSPRADGDTPRNGSGPASRTGTSPGAAKSAHEFDGKRVDISSARPNFLFLTTIPLLFSAFSGGALNMAADLSAFAVLVLGFFLLREGLKAETAYNARSAARRPAIPRKLFSMVLTGAGVALASASTGGASAGGDIVAPVIFAAIAAVLHFMAFGLDPMRDKGMDSVDRQASDRARRAVTEGEAVLAEMQQAIARTGDRPLIAHVAELSRTVRGMFARIEDDPRDLRGARRYLSVYLSGARDATVKYADLQARDPDPTARADYEALLSDLDANFAARSDALLLDDRSALDIEIEVLRDRLQRDGLRAN